jgi:hypothetical protein
MRMIWRLVCSEKGRGSRMQLDVTQLAEQMIAFPAIAGVATGDQVFPGRETPTRTGHHVVEREFSGGQNRPAVLAAIAIAQQDIFARESARLVRECGGIQAGE